LDRSALVGKISLPYLLKLKHLDTKWIEPNGYPKDDILKTLDIELKDRVKKVSIYITKYGWFKQT